jgi:hypothetical protein
MAVNKSVDLKPLLAPAFKIDLLHEQGIQKSLDDAEPEKGV